MRSRSTLEWAGTAFGAVAQGVWCGVLGSLLSAASWPALAAFSAVTMLAAAIASRGALADPARLRRGRVVLAGLVLLAAAVLLVAGRAWGHPYLGWQIIRGACFSAGVVVLGVWMARGDFGPDEAFARAVRAFAAICGVLVLAGLTGTTVAWPAAAVATVVVAGGLHVALLRYLVLTDVMSEDDRLPVWPWLLAVTTAIVAVLVLTALAAALLGGDTLHHVLAGALTVIGYVAGALAWVVALVLRGVGWLAGLAHLHVPELQPPKIAVGGGKALRPEYQPPAARSALTRVLAMTGLAVLAIGVSIAVVVFALRRLSRGLPGDEAVVEERETVRTVTSATGAALAGLRRRLSSLVGGRRRPQTPAEAIRFGYERLEQRLTRAGSPRASGTTVRAYLESIVAADNPGAAGELATLYELARYSASVVDDAQAHRFGDLARSCRTVSPASGP
jgi:hypothetical protein